MTVGSYNNLSVATLRKVEPWANQLAAKKAAGVEFTPQRVNEELSEHDILFRKIGRAVYREILPVPEGAIQMTSGANVPSSPPPAPLSAEEEASINARFVESHMKRMSMLGSILQQLEILNANSLVALGQPQNPADRYEQFLSTANE
ncbi:MAG: hypothetical protein FWB88_03975 [Defluviitaleaceae bacterium]|nr:hypothetical protein [Defluviitaleaceae bacterium]MCL2240712.1 hypothetical protein [Defluviitaleaceae bacterium]